MARQFVVGWLLHGGVAWSWQRRAAGDGSAARLLRRLAAAPLGRFVQLCPAVPWNSVYSIPTTCPLALYGVIFGGAAPAA